MTEKQGWEQRLYEVLKELWTDLNDVEDDRNPETEEEYIACKVARETLEEYEQYAKVKYAWIH